MTRGTILLNGLWQLAQTEGYCTGFPPEEYIGEHVARPRHWMPARVPAPIHQVLMEKGLLEDIYVGTNSLKARWVEESFWMYRTTFCVPAEAIDQTAWLVFDQLDLNATVRLNDQVIGTHANAHLPARFDVTGKLRTGENFLTVVLESGLIKAVMEKDGTYWNWSPQHTLTRRLWLRKADYQTGWDWNPRLMNVGILGDVRLEWSTVPRVDQVVAFAVAAGDLTAATVHVRAFVEGISDQPVSASIRARVVETDQEISQTVSVTRGLNRFELKMELKNPRLWWPVNHGEQFLYTLEVTFTAGGEEQSMIRRTGVRRVEIDQSPHPVEGRYFKIRINNRPIFCKGGNWVPADLLHSVVTADRFRRLVDLAVAANFNLLRVWGGGVFADHALCDACDEKGILLWHDFLFACSKYPGDDPEFVAEIRREATWAVRELAHHPSMILWCGNNEIEWNFQEDRTKPYRPHYAIFHYDLPQIVADEDLSKPYWPGSPWSPDFTLPNDPTVGDQHPWGGTLGVPYFWAFRKFTDRFPDEGGFLGASSPATLRQFLPEGERHYLSASWEHHDNLHGTCDYVGHWLGHSPETLNFDEYVFASALLQAEGLREYIENYRRRMFDSAAAVFWMYNDSWPVTHGWTIVDYYLRKKLAYHPVRRAFQPVTVVVADDGDEIGVYGINDTPQPWSGQIRFGLFTLAGERPVDHRQDIHLPANASTRLAAIPRSLWNQYGTTRSGAFAVLLRDGESVAQHRLFVEKFKDLEFKTPHISMTLLNETLTLTSDAFAWGLCLDIDGESPVTDNCFDLIPGLPYSLPWPKALGDPKILQIGNRLLSKDL